MWMRNGVDPDQLAPTDLDVHCFKRLSKSYDFNYMRLQKVLTTSYSLIFIAWFYITHMDLDTRKPVFGGLQTTQVQTSLRICAD